MAKQGICKVLASTELVLLSTKLFKLYSMDSDIPVDGFILNSFLKTIRVVENPTLENDVLVCFDKDNNSVGIIKVGTFGYVMPISDSNSAFTNLYKCNLPPTTKTDCNELLRFQRLYN